MPRLWLAAQRAIPFSYSLWTLRPTKVRGRRNAASLSFVPSLTVGEMELREGE